MLNLKCIDCDVIFTTTVRGKSSLERGNGILCKKCRLRRTENIRRMRKIDKKRKEEILRLYGEKFKDRYKKKTGRELKIIK